MTGRRTNDGHGMQTGTLLPLRSSLIASVLGAAQATPRKRQAIEWNGKNPVRPGQAKHSDEVILEVRRLKEQKGVMPKAIAAQLTAAGHEISHEDVKRILCYAVRAHLVPAEGAAPYIAEKKKAA
jgi:hypothetical protein